MVAVEVRGTGNGGRGERASESEVDARRSEGMHEDKGA